jgi:hypothetical protein
MLNKFAHLITAWEYYVQEVIHVNMCLAEWNEHAIVQTVLEIIKTYVIH